ncbi:MAG TPA: cyclic nucleotide-binding domain-containing protein [Chloroflexota bacterium]|nr:cyclic nucleotide-binding domain-containing protein [Chloroflexota bacterium]
MVVAESPAPQRTDRAAARAGLLARVDLFSGLDRVTLSKLAANLDPVFFADGEAACIQGEPGDSLYLVSHGTLAVFLIGDGTAERRVATLGEGACFGEMALLTGEPRTATVRAIGDVEALRLNRTRFVELLRREPTIGLAISATLSRRLRGANTTISKAMALLEPDAARSVEEESHAAAAAVSEALTAQSSQAGARPRRFTARPATVLTVATTLLFLALAFVLGRSSPPTGFVLLLGAAVTLWATALLPEFSVGLGLAASWVLFGVATPAQAFGGYGSPSFIAVVAILAIAAAISTSGLLYRVGLLLVRRLPRGLFGQAVTFLVTGILLTPLLPSSTARAALATPLALTAAQSQRLTDRGGAAALLGLSAYIGSNPLLFMFLNGSTSCLLVWGLLPEASRARFDFTTWFIAALPLALLVVVGALGMLFLVFRPSTEAASNRAGLDLQLSILGPVTRSEMAMGVILLLTILGWNVGPMLGLHFSVIGVVAFFAAVVARCFTRQTLGVLNWDFILGYGVVIGLSNLTVSLGLSEAAARAIRDAVGQGGLNPIVVIPALAVGHLLVRFLLPMDQALLILSLALIPAAPVFGMDPWVVIITLLATSAPWFFPAQLPGYQMAHEASEGRLFSHAQARVVCAGYMAVTVVALVLCVPYWRALGLITA